MAAFNDWLFGRADFSDWFFGKNGIVIPLDRTVPIENLEMGKFSCDHWVLEQPIFRLPNGDFWTLADACQGLLILGATGSGKSSGSGDCLAIKLLRMGAGGLVLCVKVGEADYWEELAKMTGREKEVIRVTEAKHGFNVFDYELKRAGRGAGLTLNMVNLFRQLQDLVDAKGGSKVSPDFWERACTRMISNAIHMQAARKDTPFTLMDVREIITTCPKRPSEIYEDEWQETLCSQVMEDLTDLEVDDYEVKTALDYFSVDVPTMGDKQRAGIHETWEGLADPLLRTPLRQRFFGETTWTPEEIIFRGKIVIIDLPVKEFDLAGKLAGVIAKFMFQKAVERRPGGDERTRRPCFLWADEFENFTTSYDNMFQKTARSSKAITVNIGQNLPGILSALGGQSADSFMRALLGNLTTQIFHANAEPHTNNYAADIIGKDWQKRQTTSAGESHQRLAPAIMGNLSANASLSDHMDYIIQPREFQDLKAGGLRNGRLIEAFFFQGTRVFSDNSNYSRVTFTQRKK